MITTPLTRDKVEALAAMFTDLVDLARKMMVHNIKINDVKANNIGFFPGTPNGHWSVFDFACFTTKGDVHWSTQIGQLKQQWDYHTYWKPDEESIRRALMSWLDKCEHPTMPLHDCLMLAAGFMEQC